MPVSSNFSRTLLETPDLYQQTSLYTGLCPGPRYQKETCQHFRPNVHADPAAPHHCAFVDAAFGDGAQMIDCPDHDPLPETQRESVWQRYGGPRPGDANP